jgi:hypothetical protein
MLVAFGMTTVCGLLGYHVYKDNFYVESEPYDFSGDAADGGMAVVYYSRAGSCEAIARLIAKHQKVPLIQITTKEPKFPLTVKGVYQASIEKAGPEDIVFPTEALAKCSKIILVSPTWMNQPASPVLAFLNSATAVVKDKDVSVVTLGTGPKWQAGPQIVRKAVETAGGGRLKQHLHFARGPHFWATPMETTLQQVESHISEIAAF